MTAGAETTPHADAASSWRDPSSGVTEEARFLGADGERVMAFLHRPSGPAVAGVVLCGSIYEDFNVNYRRETLIARELSRRGIAAVRFHYRGFGNSDALSSGAVTFASMMADTTAAAAWLTEATGVAQVVWCGSRLGALVAAEKAAETAGAPVVLWAPFRSGAELFKGMSRATLLVGVRAEARKRQSTGSSEKLLSTQESVEMLGNRVRQESYEDLRVRSLRTEAGARPMLLVQLSTSEDLTVQNAALLASWRDGGADAEPLHVRVRQMWTVPDKWESVDAKPETVSVVDGICDWIETTTRGAR